MPAKNSGKQDEQTFHILPVPNPNDPRQVQQPQPVTGGGLSSNPPEVQAHHARDPHVPSQDIINKLGEPLSREELKARAAQLNNRG